MEAGLICICRWIITVIVLLYIMFVFAMVGGVLSDKPFIIIIITIN